MTVIVTESFCDFPHSIWKQVEQTYINTGHHGLFPQPYYYIRRYVTKADDKALLNNAPFVENQIVIKKKILTNFHAPSGIRTNDCIQLNCNIIADTCLTLEYMVKHYTALMIICLVM